MNDPLSLFLLPLQKVAEDTFTSISVLERLQRFEYKDANMRDHGANVRHRAQEIAQLVSDPTRVQEERAKAHANKAKYTVVSASAMRMGGNTSFSSSVATGGGKRFDSTMLVRPSRASGSTAADGDFGSGLDSRAPRTSSGGGFPPRSPDGKSIGSSSRSPSLSPRNEGGSDAVAATRARIEKLKLEADRKEGQVGSKSGVHDQEAGKKKLTDVRVNPRIAASLGLKPVPQKRVDPAPAGQSAAGLVEGDLLGGLDDDTTPASQNASNGQPANAVWDAFAGTSTGPTAPGPATDPFSELASRNSATQAGGANSRAALPEDIFSDLAGLPKATPTAMLSPKVFHGPPGPQSHTPAVGFGEFSSVGDAGGVGVKVASTLAPPEKDPFADLFR